jgi:GNAT superfamily N-acetyltransferase
MKPRRQLRFEPVGQYDLENLVTIRIESMRESLERIGRFDPARARERFSSSFIPQQTRYIVADTERIGFLVTRPQPNWLLLDHLYIKPDWQNQGIGATVLEHVFAEAATLQLPVRVGALRDSDSNRFYIRHGFTLVESTEFDNYYVRPADSRTCRR